VSGQFPHADFPALGSKGVRENKQLRGFGPFDAACRSKPAEIIRNRKDCILTPYLKGCASGLSVFPAIDGKNRPITLQVDYIGKALRILNAEITVRR
jgi:hypothetical protein